jgi:hypothetical protein
VTLHGKLVGILPVKGSREGLSYNLVAQFRRAGVRM